MHMERLIGTGFHPQEYTAIPYQLFVSALSNEKEKTSENPPQNPELTDTCDCRKSQPFISRMMPCQALNSRKQDWKSASP